MKSIKHQRNLHRNLQLTTEKHTYINAYAEPAALAL
jgi:hypothetical protein